MKLKMGRWFRPCPAGPDELVIDFQMVQTPIGSNISTQDMYMFENFYGQQPVGGSNHSSLSTFKPNHLHLCQLNLRSGE